MPIIFPILHYGITAVGGAGIGFSVAASAVTYLRFEANKGAILHSDGALNKEIERAAHYSGGFYQEEEADARKNARGIWKSGNQSDYRRK